VREEWDSKGRDTGMLSGNLRDPKLTLLMACSTSLRAVSELAASTECDLPGFADSSRCL
jgi:hypothetical protein